MKLGFQNYDITSTQRDIVISGYRSYILWNHLHTCGKQSGLDSNMTIKTPIGTVTWFSSKLSANCVRRRIFPRFSNESSAICLKPDAKTSNFPDVNVSRATIGAGIPAFFAFSISFWFSSRILFFFSWSKSASLLMIDARCIGVNFCNARLPARAKW